ncbi:hypothetical protein MNB_SV-6-1433 [hydrothermal vent metagenome]|uniref:DUF3298 domain-containing protein n=1 Tax=hydrothermal vent metagenome TaxID=652676 RepID=A0A1W1BH28_9ZZZZ
MKYIIALVLIVVTLFSKESSDGFYKLKSIVTQQSECMSGRENRLCLNKKFTYPKSDILNDDIANGLDIYIQKLKSEFQKESLESYEITVDDIDTFGVSEYLIESRLKLFDYNRPILTLQSYSYAYTGGAHGNYNIEYINYDVEAKKEYSLEDLVDFNNSKFLHIAKIEYKKSEALLPDESLQNAGWFEDRFQLTTNFAVTKSGLLFSYAPYEIKSFASGITTFLLTYDKFLSFIKPNTPLVKVAQEYKRDRSKKIVSKLENGGKIEITITDNGNSYFLKATVESYGKNPKTWLSLSFPQLDRDHLKKLSSYGVNTFKIYPKGSRIYNKKRKSVMRANYPLVEATRKNGEYSISLKIRKDRYIPYSCVNYRVTTRSSNLLKDRFDFSFEDQQGFIVKRVCF